MKEGEVPEESYHQIDMVTYLTDKHISLLLPVDNMTEMHFICYNYSALNYVCVH